MHVKQKITIVEILCALFVMLFIYTGLNKLLDHDTFKFQLGRSPYLQHFSALLAATLPAGDHTLVLGEVIGAGVEHEGEPLTLADAGFKYSG